LLPASTITNLETSSKSSETLVVLFIIIALPLLKSNLEPSIAYNLFLAVFDKGFPFLSVVFSISFEI